MILIYLTFSSFTSYHVIFPFHLIILEINTIVLKMLLYACNPHKKNLVITSE